MGIYRENLCTFLVIFQYLELHATEIANVHFVTFISYCYFYKLSTLLIVFPQIIALSLIKKAQPQLWLCFLWKSC